MSSALTGSALLAFVARSGPHRPPARVAQSAERFTRNEQVKGFDSLLGLYPPLPFVGATCPSRVGAAGWQLRDPLGVQLEAVSSRLAARGELLCYARAMASGRPHFEPFVHLVDVTSDAALIAWGGFYLQRGERGWAVVDDDDLPAGARRQGGTIGARSASYGRAVVEVRDGSGTVVARETTDDRNHVWVGGLAPGTEYGYRILVDGQPWVPERHHDWVLGADGSAGRLEPSQPPGPPVACAPMLTTTTRSR